MSSWDSFGVDNPTDKRGENSGFTSPNRQEAFHRVLLYLQALRVPEEKALELAREAIRVAGSNHRDSADSECTHEAMGVLRGLLVEQLPLLRKELLSLNNEASHVNLSRVSSMPQLNRGFMVPAAIDLIPWRTSLVNFLKRGAVIVSRPFNFLILFIFLIIFFVLLTLWK